jgi:glycosyltransferase involved in cell wall biosynthesis
MFENRDIVVFSGDWNRQAGVLQHFANVLVNQNRFLWVSGIPLRAPVYDRRDIGRILEKGRRMFATSVNADKRIGSITEVHPFFIPYYDIPLIRNFNNGQLRSLVGRKIKELGFHNYLLLTQNPMMAEVVGTLGETSSHYLCIDDFGANKNSFRCLMDLEKELLKRIDTCFCMSDLLLKDRVPDSGEVHFMPEGVDLEHFHTTGTETPALLSDIKGPVIGYAGLLEWWVDLELIAKCATAFPQATFVVLGAIKTDIGILRQHPNIVCAGHIPFDQLPRYLEAFDVGLIPRKINRLTVAMNPLKLLEYLAMGMAVVSTDLPEVRKFNDFVLIAKDHDQFVKMVGEALKDCGVERRALRRAQAERFSWKSVVDKVSDTILRIETEKQARRGN